MSHPQCTEMNWTQAVCLQCPQLIFYVSECLQTLETLSKIGKIPAFMEFALEGTMYTSIVQGEIGSIGQQVNLDHLDSE